MPFGPKVSVVSAYGVGCLGHIDPKPNMQVDLGKIVTVGTETVTVSGTAVGELTPCYPGQLQALSGHVYYSYSWPTGDGSLQYGHADVTPIAAASPTVSAVVTLPHGQTHAFTR